MKGRGALLLVAVTSLCACGESVRWPPSPHAGLGEGPGQGSYTSRRCRPQGPLCAFPAPSPPPSQDTTDGATTLDPNSCPHPAAPHCTPARPSQPHTDKTRPQSKGADRRGLWAGGAGTPAAEAAPRGNVWRPLGLETGERWGRGWNPLAPVIQGWPQARTTVTFSWNFYKRCWWGPQKSSTRGPWASMRSMQMPRQP